jgi:hypothetical protein
MARFRISRREDAQCRSFGSTIGWLCLRGQPALPPGKCPRDIGSRCSETLLLTGQSSPALRQRQRTTSSGEGSPGASPELWLVGVWRRILGRFPKGQESKWIWASRFRASLNRADIAFFNVRLGWHSSCARSVRISSIDIKNQMNRARTSIQDGISSRVGKAFSCGDQLATRAIRGAFGDLNRNTSKECPGRSTKV